MSIVALKGRESLYSQAKNLIYASQQYGLFAFYHFTPILLSEPGKFGLLHPSNHRMFDKSDKFHKFFFWLGLKKFRFCVLGRYGHYHTLIWNFEVVVSVSHRFGIV